MSLPEVVRELVLFKRQSHAQRLRDLSLAWQIAAFSYPRALPKFEDLQRKLDLRPAPKQSALHHMAALAQIGMRGVPERMLTQ